MTDEEDTRWKLLPYELLLNIFVLVGDGPPRSLNERSITSQPTLAKSARTCRSWSRACVDVLYFHVTLVGKKSVRKFHWALLKNPRLRLVVRRFDFIETLHDHWSAPVTNIIHDIHSLCPNISVHRIDKTAEENLGVLWIRKTHSFGRLRRPARLELTQNVAGKLTRLEIIKTIPIPLRECIPGFEFPSLQELSISGCYLIPREGDNLSGHGTSQRLAFPNLRHLRLVNSLFDMNYKFPPMPRLRIFEFVSGSITSISSFLRNLHSASRQIYSLTLCPDDMATPYAEELAVNFNRFTSLEYLRLGSSLFRLIERGHIPENIRELEIMDMGNEQDGRRKFTLYALEGLLANRIARRGLSRIHVVATERRFYGDCLALAQGDWEGVQIEVTMRTPLRTSPLWGTL